VIAVPRDNAVCNDKNNEGLGALKRREQMQKIVRLLIVWCVVLSGSMLFAGCCSHSPVLVFNSCSVIKESSNTYPPHKNKVFLTRETLPPEAKFDIIATIDISKTVGGSIDRVKVGMADKARKLGADAIIGFNTWRQPCGWSWSAPQGTGQAVKITDPASVDLSKLKGEWR